MEKNLEKELIQKFLVLKEGPSAKVESNGLRDFADFNFKQIFYLFSANVSAAVVASFAGWVVYNRIIEGINYLK